MAVSLIFAHRGLHVTQRENTIAAFEAARDAGADGVELDVRRCAEGEMVVHHDPAIAGRAIAVTPLAELPGYVATLAAALAACAGMRVNVEIKNLDLPGESGYDASGDFARRVVELLTGSSWTDTAQVSCFDLATCRAVRAADPSVYVGWLLAPGADLAAGLALAAAEGFTAINPHYSAVDAGLVASVHRLGLEINTWTVNRPGDLAAMLALGVDAVITDDPAAARAASGRPPGGVSPMA